MKKHAAYFRSILSACAIALSLAQIPAQTPHAPTVNNQDEVVNFVLQFNATPEHALALLRSDNKQETNRYTTCVFELRRVWAFELRPSIEQMVDLEKGCHPRRRNHHPRGCVGAQLPCGSHHT